jgi:hypothetical protein
MVAEHQSKTTGYSVVWQGNDEVTMSATIFNASWAAKETLMIFPTTQDATNYLNAFDKSGYTLITTNRSKGLTGIYSNPTVQNPSTFQWWQHTQLNSYGNYDNSQITQYDNILQFDSNGELT